MKLIVTIDTEEDNWQSAGGSTYHVSNIREIPKLQQLFDDYCVKPTYLLTYPVVVNSESVSILGDIIKTRSCELGAHCHPWNTPPYEEQRTRENSMLCNLPQALQFEKIRTLSDQIKTSFGVTPIAFRAGRWGFSQDVAGVVKRAGFLVDSSVTPYVDWRSDCGPDFSSVPLKPYYRNIAELGPGWPTLDLVEIPATIGFLQTDFERAGRLTRVLSHNPLRVLHLGGLLSTLKLLNRVWLSPEVQTEDQLIELLSILKEKNFPYINLVFHSPSLKPGLAPFVRTERDREAFYNNLRKVLVYLRSADVSSITLQEAYREIVSRSHPSISILERNVQQI